MTVAAGGTSYLIDFEFEGTGIAWDDSLGTEVAAGDADADSVAASDVKIDEQAGKATSDAGQETADADPAPAEKTLSGCHAYLCADCNN